MNGQYPTDGSLPSVRSPIAVKADNLIRRFLRVSNPNNPNEIADGLLRLYPGAAREQQLEEAGLPFYRVQTVEVGGRQDGAPATVELVQGRNDTGRDLDSLLHNAVLKGYPAGTARVAVGDRRHHCRCKPDSPFRLGPAATRPNLRLSPPARRLRQDCALCRGVDAISQCRLPKPRQEPRRSRRRPAGDHG